MPKTPAERAEHLLTHYMRTAFTAAGLNWNEDNDAEIGNIVDALGEMAEAASRRHVELHLAQDPHLYPDGSQS